MGFPRMQNCLSKWANFSGAITVLPCFAARARRRFFAVAVLAGFLSPALAQHSPSAAWQSTGCDSFGISEAPESVKCGFVEVPLRHAKPHGPSISLATVVIPAQTSQAEPDPLFIAQGGPGGSTIDTFADVLINQPGYRPVLNRDLVLWDQRGTLHSKPALL